GRDQLAIVAQDMIRESPIVGHGFGAYNILGPGQACYPHNIFLEITSETGLVGCALFVALLASVLVCVRKQFKSPSGIDMFALMGAIIQLVGAQFSGDLYDSRMMLFFFAMLAIPMVRKES
ncbi:MAG TPA: O-antigen ligase family protein, partial [Fimbriimonas sp.]|nr:O-antigen ligase family protein [Fimbriimonas sp.]